MAAMTTRLLHLRPVIRTQPHTLRHISSSSDTPEPQPEPKSQTSSLNDVKASLRQQTPPQNNRPYKPLPFTNPNPNPPPPPSKLASLEEIRRNLSEYRLRAAAPPPPQHPSFQELYQRNVISKSDGAASSSNSVQSPSYDAIRQSLRKLGPSAPPPRNDGGPKGVDRMSLAKFKDSFKMKPDSSDTSRVIIRGSGTDSSLPSSIFWKEEDKDGGGGGGETFMRSYKYAELGERLKMLRPDKKKGKKFSLQELNDRLVSLRDMDERESQSNVGGLSFKELRESLAKMTNSKEEKDRVKMMQRLDVFEKLGGTPSFMLYPPKEHLVEKYFHPDNMSSAEKLKLELKKVRDEFKMSESDCGSARVQVAQLTTKIKHLSSVLQKKDKHSRKGLQAMVQRRKKLLKYLRRTDWDSYSLVLSKLGLRDNPDIKA